MPPRKAARIMVAVDEASAEPLYAQIYDQVRAAIVEGRLAAGERPALPQQLNADFQRSSSCLR